MKTLSRYGEKDMIPHWFQRLICICIALLLFSPQVHAQKKGVAGNVQNANKVGATWCYNWGSGTPSNLPAGVEFVPMWWGYYGATQDQDTAGAIALKNAGASYLLTYNEPDHTDQANLSVSYALQGFKQAGIACTTAGLGCISPAAADDYDSWMVQFMQGVSSQGMRCDSVAIHCYLRDPYAFLNYVDGIHNKYGKPVWITEFAPTDWASPTTVSIPEVINFIRVAIPGLESRSYVQRYSWYCGTVPGPDVLGTAALFNSDGSVTSAGLVYQNPATTSVIRCGAYKLQNRADGKCLDNMGLLNDGATVCQWDSSWSYNQRWRVTYSGGYFKFQCVTGDKLLDTLGNSADGSPIGQWGDSSNWNQQWSIVPTDSGYFKIVNRASGKCLDTGGQTKNGDGMQNWYSGSSYNQHWQFVTTEAPPDTTVALSGTKGNGQWYTSNVTVTLNAAVYSKPITGTYYTLDGGAQQTYASPFTVSGDGAHTVVYWSNDTNNNWEPSHTVTFYVDATPPVTTSSAANAAVTLNATDAASGVAATYYTVDGGSQQTYSTPFTLSSAGKHTITYWSADIAGNIETAQSTSVTVNPPSTSISLSGTSGNNAWYVSNVDVTLTAAEGTLPVSATYYTIDGGAQQTYSTPFTVSGDGTHTVVYWSVDTAGNSETAQSQSVHIDTTSPVTTASVTNGTVTISPSDATSGIATTYYTIDGGSTQTYSSAFTMNSVGNHSIVYWSVDNSGNTETSHTLSYSIYAPTITSLSPSSVSGAKAFTLTVNGANFVSGSIIKWNGTNMTTTYVSSTQLTASINKYYTTLTSYPGSASIVALNPNGSRSAGAKLTITAPILVPSISSLSPSSVSGAKTFTLTVNGVNFVSGSIIKWNGTNMTTTFVSSTQITASINKYYTTLSSYPGSASITVLNPDGNRSTGATLTITAPVALPVITSLSPSTITGATTFTLTINGTGFVSGAVIKWNGTNMTTSYISSTQLTATISKYYDTLSSYPGSATVSVLNPDGGRSSGAALTITSP